MKLKHRLLAAVLTGVLLISSNTLPVRATDSTPDDPNTSNQTDQPQADPNAADTAAQDAAMAAALANVTATDPTGKAASEEELELQMAAQLAIAPETNSCENWPQAPQVTADSAIVMDVNSGAILYGKQIDKRQYPASITKVMTALLALENGDVNTDQVTFSEDSVSFLEYGDAHIGMTPGETIRLNDAMYGMLLASANEVSYAVAESIGNKLGIGYTGFIEKMTERAKELGCENSHFVNANGLPDDQHYVSARDMALIGSAAFSHEEFRTVIKTLDYTIPPTNLVAEERIFQQNHKMIYPGNQYYYEYCVGGKTGYTDDARTTLITYAEKDGLKLVCVVLRTRGGVAYEDTRALFDYAYANFQSRNLKETEASEDFAEIPEDAEVVLPNGAEFKDLEKTVTQKEKDSREAVVEYTYNGNTVGKADVTLTQKYVEDHSEKAKAAKAEAKKAEKEKESGWPLPLKIIIGVVAAGVLLFAGLLALAVREQKKRRRRRQQKRRQQARNARSDSERRIDRARQRYGTPYPPDGRRMNPRQYGGRQERPHPDERGRRNGPGRIN